MKLAKILAISFFVSGLVVILFLGGYFNYMYGNILTEKIYSHLQTAVESKADHVEMFLHEHKQAVLTLSDDIVFRELLTTDKSKSGYKEKFERANKQLESIVAINDEFNEVFILDSDGKIAATSHTLEEIGADFSGDAYFLKGKDGLYLKNAYYDEDLKEKSMGMSAPVLDEKTGEVIGVIVAEISLKELIDIMTDRIGLGETGEVYVINKDKLLITPSRFFDNSIMAQKVDTENSQKCLSDIEEYISKGEIFSHTQHNYENDPMKFLDYRGENVLGAHDIIPEMNWCVLAEIDESEALGIPKRQVVNKNIAVSFFSIIGLTLAGFVLGGRLEEVYLGKEIKESKFAKVLSKIKIRYFFIFALVFSVVYFFVVTSFFQGWRNARFFDAVPDLIFFVIAFVIFGHAFKLKNLKTRRLLAWGAGLLCLIKLSEIPLQELQAIRTIFPFLWYPSMIITALSFLLILASFEEVSK